MRLLLVPHALTEWNAKGRFQGWSDLPLSEMGKHQAVLLAHRLRRESIDFCLASDLRRAQETATAICGPRGLTVQPEPLLREMNFGAWEGLTWLEICQGDDQVRTIWEAGLAALSPPDGETLQHVARRVGDFLAAIADGEHAMTQTMLVVAHRGSLRVLLSLALGLASHSWWQFWMEPASVSELRLFKEGAVLHSLNDTSHLREATDAG
jgi:broad specificity phosphatase PhoE